MLKNITSDYHYHTVTADSEDILNAIESELDAMGYLIRKN
ncbi:MAG: 3H domain-containing protein [Eubacterium sp.]|nr:3H domain-containing protein [Eubacterium sp.]